MNFIGDITCNMDDKGRIKMPALFSKEFPEADKGRFMIARGVEQCLVIYPLEVWAKRQGEIAQLSSYNPEHLAYLRVIRAGLTEVELDSADRFLISKSLMRYLGTGKEFVLSGYFDHIKIWEATKYEDMLNADTQDVLSLSKAVGDYLESKQPKN